MTKISAGETANCFRENVVIQFETNAAYSLGLALGQSWGSGAGENLRIINVEQGARDGRTAPTAFDFIQR